MDQRWAFGIRFGWHLAPGIAWLVGIWILLGWASPVQGQVVRRAEGQIDASSGGAAAAQPTQNLPGQGGRNGFWPLGANGLMIPRPPSSPTASSPNSPETFSSPARPTSSSAEKDVQGASSPKASALPPEPNGSSAAMKTKPPQRQEQPSEKTDAAARSSLPSRPSRLREGSRISQQKGVFTMAGDRVIFSPLDASLPKMVVLENLSLQRVIQNIQSSPEEEIWLVTGRVTEFQGVNYLLLERATRIDEADLETPPAPLSTP